MTPENKTAMSHTYRVWIAGDFDRAQEIVREFCFERGECFAVAPVEYIYSGGQEAGVCVTRINYSRFPAEDHEVRARVESLAARLRVGLCQMSYSIEGPELTEWVSFRETT